jgi:hypothetical protein
MKSPNPVLMLVFKVYRLWWTFYTQLKTTIGSPFFELLIFVGFLVLTATLLNFCGLDITPNQSELGLPTSKGSEMVDGGNSSPDVASGDLDQKPVNRPSWQKASNLDISQDARKLPAFKDAETQTSDTFKSVGTQTSDTFKSAGTQTPSTFKSAGTQTGG